MVRVLPGAACIWGLWLSLATWNAAVAGDGRVQIEHLDGTPVAAFSVRGGERWCVGWNHSVAGFPVRDCYRVRSGRMVLERSHQPDFAAGLGHLPGRGTVRPDGQGGYWIEHIDEPVPNNLYRLRVGSGKVDHRIHHPGGVIALSERLPGQAVVIRLIPGTTEGRPHP